MSDYSQITFFTPKDSLATGNPNKIIYGSDVDAELSAISTAIATKADVDGDAIGAGTPATELSVDNLKLDANKIISTNTDGDIELEPNGAGYVVITNVDVNAGNIDNTVIGATTAAAGTFTTANATTVDTTNLEVTNLKAKDGTAAGSIADVTGVVTLASSVLTTTDINGGTIDGAIIGGAAPAAITGTTLTANTSLALATGATVTAILDEDAMTSNSATALATQQSIKAYVDAQVTAQDLDVTTDSGTIAIDLDSETLTVAGGTGLDTSAVGNTVTVAIDSTVATLTGAQTLTNKVLTSPDINTPDIDGGSIDGTVIGAATPAAGSFTTGQFGTSLNVDGTVTADGLTVDTNTLHVDAVNNRVGIGTPSPAYLIDAQTAAGNAQLSVTAGGDLAQLILKSTDTTGNSQINFADADSSNVGMLQYFHNDNHMEFTVNGSEAMRITSAGNVGIGLTNPAAPLEVQKSVSGNFVARFQNTNATTPYGVWIKEPASAANGYPSFQISDSTGTSIRLRVDSGTGNVGIGTASPGVSLHVDASGGGAIRASRSSVSANYVQMDHDGTNGTIRASGANALIFDTNSGERMRIDSSGLVGIGTTSPQSVASGYGALTIGGTSGGGINFNSTGSAFGQIYGNNTQLSISAFGSRRITFNTNGSERMRIDSSGNVGIGVVPATDWSAAYHALQIGTTATFMGAASGSGEGNWISNNAIFSTSGSWEYLQTASASSLDMQSSTAPFRFRYAASGTAGTAISWSEAMRIDSSGNLLVGTTDDTGTNAEGFLLYEGSGGSRLYIGHVNGTANGTQYAVFNYNTGKIGDIVQSGTTAVLYNTSSDARLKENIADAEDAGAKVDAIQVRQFDWKADGSHQDYGMIAQELMTVAPEAVSGDPESDDMMGVDYSKLVPMLVKEIQSLRARVHALESK